MTLNDHARAGVNDNAIRHKSKIAEYKDVRRSGKLVVNRERYCSTVPTNFRIVVKKIITKAAERVYVASVIN